MAKEPDYYYYITEEGNNVYMYAEKPTSNPNYAWRSTGKVYGGSMIVSNWEHLPVYGTGPGTGVHVWQIVD